MVYYLEIWLRGFARDYLRSISARDKESYHPHITLVRPFEILSDEGDIKGKIADFCEGIAPVPFSLEGEGFFAGYTHYVPVVESDGLLRFNDGLEQLLAESVEFAPKLNDKKVLHASVEAGGRMDSCPRIEQYMLRLTAMRGKRIWFSYDLVKSTVLDREESLDKARWHQSVHQFLDKNGLVATVEGFKKK